MVLGYFLCAVAVVTGLRAGDLPVVVVSSSVRLLLGKCPFCVYRVFSVNYLCCGDIQSKSFFFFWEGGEWRGALTATCTAPIFDNV